ncbi:xylulokinase [Streptomyces sp. NPDC005438]|uniref:xylulokinase n=1 Tax=Streptomyces sp. NPDC005438 TaxID=3156880 RepID=UPI0033A35F94
MAESRVVIGVDSSTQGTKALAVDIDSGDVLGTGRAYHTVSQGNARETDPEQWWGAFTEAVARTGHAHRAEAVSVAGQQHGLVTLDAQGQPVRPALLWNDVRSAPQAARMVEHFGAHWWADRVGSVPTAAFTASKWQWLREREPSALRRITGVRLPHDYLTERLTGEATTDRGDASGTGWWGADGYDQQVLEHLELDPRLLPRVLSPLESAGKVVRDSPLPDGIPVGAGTGDNMAAALGLGLRPGQPVLSLGTSGTVYAVSRSRPGDPSGVVAGFADALGDWLPLSCTLNCTLAVDRLATLLGIDREEVEPDGEAVVLPYLDGERTPNLPYASGLIHGLRHDTTPGQLLQAAYDGAAHSLLDALDEVLASGSVPPDATAPLLLIGGGAQGTAWRETIRRLSGRPVQVPRAQEVVALGAAAQAAALLTEERPDEVARRWRTTDGPCWEPLPRDHATRARITRTQTHATPLLNRPGE